MRKSWGIVAALSGVALAIPGAALAADPTTPAPTGQQVADQSQQATQDGSAHSDAVAAQVDGVASAGETHAKAGPDDASAEGDALTLGGKPPAEQFGGKTSGDNGNASGNLIDTKDTPLGRLEVTPWEAKTSKTDTCRNGNSKAAVARLSVIDKKTLHVNVLQSDSNADYCRSAQGFASTGHGSSDGATVDLGDGALAIALLHSEADSSKSGKTYVLSINGNEIANNEQAGGKCTLQIPGVLGLTCLTVGGGAGSVMADAAQVALGDGQFTGTVSQASGAGAPAAQPAVSPETIDNGNGNANAAPAAEANSGGSLAKTGGEIGGVTLLGAALVLMGEALRRRGTLTRA